MFHKLITRNPVHSLYFSFLSVQQFGVICLFTNTYTYTDTKRVASRLFWFFLHLGRTRQHQHMRTKSSRSLALPVIYYTTMLYTTIAVSRFVVCVYADQLCYWIILSHFINVVRTSRMSRGSFVCWYFF